MKPSIYLVDEKESFSGGDQMESKSENALESIPNASYREPSIVTLEFDDYRTGEPLDPQESDALDIGLDYPKGLSNGVLFWSQNDRVPQLAEDSGMRRLRGQELNGREFLLLSRRHPAYRGRQKTSFRGKLTQLRVIQLATGDAKNERGLSVFVGLEKLTGFFVRHDLAGHMRRSQIRSRDPKLGTRAQAMIGKEVRDIHQCARSVLSCCVDSLVAPPGAFDEPIDARLAKDLDRLEERSLPGIVHPHEQVDSRKTVDAESLQASKI
jgi:hypothetical protein